MSFILCSIYAHHTNKRVACNIVGTLTTHKAGGGQTTAFAVLSSVASAREKSRVRGALARLLQTLHAAMDGTLSVLYRAALNAM